MIDVKVYANDGFDAPRRDVTPFSSQVPVLPRTGDYLVDGDGGVLTVKRCEVTLGDPVVAVIIDAEGLLVEDLVAVGFGRKV